MKNVNVSRITFIPLSCLNDLKLCLSSRKNFQKTFPGCVMVKSQTEKNMFSRSSGKIQLGEILHEAEVD